MTDDSIEIASASGPEWLLTPEERESLQGTRRLFLLGLGVAVLLAVGLAGILVWTLTRGPWHATEIGAPALGFLALSAAALWCVNRARLVRQDIRDGRAEVQWGRLTRFWAHLRVAEVEGTMFPLQMMPIPGLRPGERVRLRFAPRSRLTLRIDTLRQVVAAEVRGGRVPCPAALAELELGEKPSPDPSGGDALQPGPTGSSGGRRPGHRISS
jgi:hypothetical protein